MIDFESTTDIQQQIDQLQKQKWKHQKDYLYGGSNVYWKAKKKLSELNKEIYQLEKKKEQIINQQPRLL